jgi:hypothetical protein
MTACTCPTCGHEVPPMVDWTHFERDVSELAELWLNSQEAALAAIRAGRIPVRDPDLENAKDRLIRTYFPSPTYAFLMLRLDQGRIDLIQRGTYTPTVWTADEGVVWPAHDSRPGGAA